MRIETTLEFKSITCRIANRVLVLDLTMAGELPPDVLEGLAAQWPELRAYLAAHQRPEAKSDPATLALGERETPAVSLDGAKMAGASLKSARLSVVAGPKGCAASLRLVLRVMLAGMRDLRELAEMVGQDVDVLVEVASPAPMLPEVVEVQP